LLHKTDGSREVFIMADVDRILVGSLSKKNKNGED
jgi:hypothetical protein